MASRNFDEFNIDGDLAHGENAAFDAWGNERDENQEDVKNVLDNMNREAIENTPTLGAIIPPELQSEIGDVKKEPEDIDLEAKADEEKNLKDIKELLLKCIDKDGKMDPEVVNFLKEYVDLNQKEGRKLADIGKSISEEVKGFARDTSEVMRNNIEAKKENIERIRSNILDAKNNLKQNAAEHLHSSVMKVLDSKVGKKLTEHMIMRGIEYSEEIKGMEREEAEQTKEVERLNQEKEDLLKQHDEEVKKLASLKATPEDMKQINDTIMKIADIDKRIEDNYKETLEADKNLKKIQDEIITEKKGFAETYIADKHEEISNKLNEQINKSFNFTTKMRNIAFKNLENDVRALRSIRDHIRVASLEFQSKGISAITKLEKAVMATEHARCRYNLKVTQLTKTIIKEDMKNLEAEMKRDAAPRTKRAFQEFLFGRDKVRASMQKQMDRLKAELNKCDKRMQVRRKATIKAGRWIYDKIEKQRDVKVKLEEKKNSLEELFKSAKEQAKRINENRPKDQVRTAPAKADISK